MLEEILKVSVGVIVPGVLAWIATRFPSVKYWLSHNSPSYLIILAASLSALIVTIGFAVYLEYVRRQELASLRDIQLSVGYAAAESRIARDEGKGNKNWHNCGKHAQIALDHSDAANGKISNRTNDRLSTWLP